MQRVRKNFKLNVAFDKMFKLVLHDFIILTKKKFLLQINRKGKEEHFFYWGEGILFYIFFEATANKVYRIDLI